MADYEIYRGDNETLTFTFRDEDDNAIDISGWTVWFGVYNSPTDTDDEAAILKKVTSHSDPTNGETTLDLSQSDTDIATEGYKAAIQTKDSAGNIKTWGWFSLAIKNDFITETS